MYVLPYLFVPGEKHKLQASHASSLLSYYCLKSQRKKAQPNRLRTDKFKQERLEFLPVAGEAVVKCDDNHQFSEGSVVCLFVCF